MNVSILLVRDKIVENIQGIVCDLERRGKELASLGIQFSTFKVLDLPACKVRITAAYGIPRRRSLWDGFGHWPVGSEVR